MASEQWDFSAEELASLKEHESAAFGSGPGAQTSLEMARRIFEENAVDAAMAIVHVCKHGGTDRIRFDAAKYITERTLGPVDKTGPAGGVDDMLLAFAKQIAGIG